MIEFRMPSLGADMAAGKLVEWLKKPGDAVRQGDIVAVVETQKGAIEVEIFETGVLTETLIQPGTTVPVGTPLALIAGEGEPARARPAPPPERAIAPAPPTAPSPVAPPPAAAGARPLASPAARRLAAARGVDLASLTGSGPGGAVISTDVERAADRAPAAARGRIDLAAMRQAIAAAMARSKREIPHYYLSTTIDMTTALAWLEARNADRPPAERLLPAVLLVKAVALALRPFPELNGFYTADGFRPAEDIHVGVAIALRGGGLVAPAIRGTAARPLDELMASFRDLVGRVRAGTLRSSELADPTITVSSLGERGVEGMLAVIYPPQVAIVGFGSVTRRPWATDDRVEVRPTVTASLAGDHRVSDGHRAALFLREVDDLLQSPERL